MTKSPILRVLRVIEYAGSAEFIRKALENRNLKGTKTFAEGSIREAVLGDTAEVLLEAEVRAVEEARDAKQL